MMLDKSRENTAGAYGNNTHGRQLPEALDIT